MTPGTRPLVFAAFAVLSLSRHVEAGAPPAVSPVRPTAGEILILFDDSAAERMVDAIGRPTLSETEARSLLENRGIAAMVTKTGVFSPRSTPRSFVADMRAFVRTHRYPKGDFGLDWVHHNRSQVRSLVRELRADEGPLRRRITTRLARYAPRTGPVTVKVYFVAGGMSDGFVLDGDPELALFVALDKASGDAKGVEQNLTHELYHVLQKASAAKTPGAVRFAATLDRQPVLQQLLATTLWEGTANLAADARESTGKGPYASMWRERYLRNLTPRRSAENFRLFESLLVDLDRGRIDWAAAYRRGFTGDAPLYFVGMEMARSLGSSHGASYFEELFVRPPTRFFQDYVRLCATDPSLPRFSADAVKVLERLPASW